MTDRFTKPARPDTLIAKLGFQDSDLKTPRHDEIMLWLDNVLGDTEFLWRLTGGHKSFRPEWLREQEDVAIRAVSDQIKSEAKAVETAFNNYLREQAEQRLLKLQAWRLPERPQYPAPSLGAVTWERPVGDPRWVAGFIDLYATVKVYSGASLNENVGRYGKFIMPEWFVFKEPLGFAFEVKSEVPSLGELIRQVRFYETKLNERAQFVVVTPDNRWAETLLKQRIWSLEYPSGLLTRNG